MLNEKQIIPKIKELIKNNDRENKIELNEIIGIDDYGEIVYLENIYLYKYSDSKSLQAQGMTFRTVSVDDIRERRDEDHAYDERDLWVECVREDRTNEGLLDWWEDCCDEADSYGQLYPFDDNSYREEFESAYKELSEKQKEQIREVLGTKGDYEEEWDSEVNENSDWYTVYCGMSGNVISDGSYCCGEKGNQTATDRVNEWKLQLYPELIKFLAQTYDDLK